MLRKEIRDPVEKLRIRENQTNAEANASVRSSITQDLQNI